VCVLTVATFSLIRRAVVEEYGRTYGRTVRRTINDVYVQQKRKLSILPNMISINIGRISALLVSDIISLFYQRFTLFVQSFHYTLTLSIHLLYQQFTLSIPFTNSTRSSFHCFAKNAQSYFVVLPKDHTVLTHCTNETVSDIRSASTLFQVVTWEWMTVKCKSPLITMQVI